MEYCTTNVNRRVAMLLGIFVSMMTPRLDLNKNSTSKSANLTKIATRSKNAATKNDVRSEDVVTLITTVSQASDAIAQECGA